MPRPPCGGVARPPADAVESTDRVLATLPAAVAHWRTTDPVLADLARSDPPQPWAARDPDPFVDLCTSITHQQVSLEAGRTIYARFEAAVGGAGTVRPATVLAAGEDALRGAGLSRAKARYVLDLAARVESGDLDLGSLADLDDDAVVAALTAVQGIGAWTAKMFLLFHLGRPDVCPWEDLGVRLAVQRFYGVPEKQAAAWLRDEARARWSPYNSAAARVLWTARRSGGL